MKFVKSAQGHRSTHFQYFTLLWFWIVYTDTLILIWERIVAFPIWWYFPSCACCQLQPWQVSGPLGQCRVSCRLKLHCYVNNEKKKIAKNFSHTLLSESNLFGCKCPSVTFWVDCQICILNYSDTNIFCLKEKCIILHLEQGIIMWKMRSCINYLCILINYLRIVTVVLLITETMLSTPSHEPKTVSHQFTIITVLNFSKN